jgi:MFS-type transporter involved in bile tolerance (Atg22 family)
LLLVAGFSLGFAGQAVKVCSDTVIQREIPDESLGRIFSLFDMSVNVALVSGIILVALLAPVSGVAAMLYIGVGMGLALASLWYWRAGSKNPA